MRDAAAHRGTKPSSRTIRPQRAWSSRVRAASAAGLAGHTLGAAGALEAAFCWLALTGDGQLPPHIWDGAADPELPALQVVTPGQRFGAGQPRRCMSNSFAFGGNNISLILGALA